MNPAEFQANTPYATLGTIAIDAPANVRLAFIRRTYTHLAAAIYALVGLEFLYFNALPLDRWVTQLFGVRFGWIGLIIAYMVVSSVADRWARSDTSAGTQYLGLFAYVFAFSVILCPLLWIANQLTTDIGGRGYNPILIAAVATLGIFGVLTATVFLTRKDFSFLGPILGIVFLLFAGAIVLSWLGFLNLGTGFILLVIVFAAGAILYDTSNVLHHYRTTQHVAASLKLFASVGLLFWYILLFAMSMSRN